MLAGELKSTIRQMKGAPEIAVEINGNETWIKVQKSSLLDALSESFDRRTEETNIHIDPTTGRITFGVSQELDEYEDLLS